MPHTVLELPQIKIFLGNILETKTIFITLAWQVGLPLPEIESSMEIPNYILVRLQLKIYSVFKPANHKLLFAFLDIYAKNSIYLL
jgi:hypothetical protein